MSKKIKKLKKLLPFSVLMVAPLIVFPASNFIEKDYKNNEQDTKHITLNYNFGGQ
jgi:cytochrome c oxidase assembly protein Cox11